MGGESPLPLCRINISEVETPQLSVGPRFNSSQHILSSIGLNTFAMLYSLWAYVNGTASYCNHWASDNIVYKQFGFEVLAICFYHGSMSSAIPVGPPLCFMVALLVFLLFHFQCQTPQAPLLAHPIKLTLEQWWLWWSSSLLYQLLLLLYTYCSCHTHRRSTSGALVVHDSLYQDLFAIASYMYYIILYYII